MAIHRIDETLVYFDCRIPEHGLLMAVLARAVRDLEENIERHHTRDAVGWFKSTDTTEPIGFCRIVEELDLNPFQLNKIQLRVKEAEDRLYGGKTVSRDRPGCDGGLGNPERTIVSQICRALV